MASFGAMVIEKVAGALNAVGVVESVTVTTTLLVPGFWGVPLITPLDKLIDKPDGRPVADQLYGVVPPAATTVVL
jgi:hypothetical protein